MQTRLEYNTVERITGKEAITKKEAITGKKAITRKLLIFQNLSRLQAAALYFYQSEEY